MLADIHVSLIIHCEKRFKSVCLCEYFTEILNRSTNPPTTSLKNLKAKITEARKKNSLHIDIAFWGGVTPDNHEELLPMANLGVCGFKATLGSSITCHLNKESLKRALETLEETNCVFAVSSRRHSRSTS